MTETEKELLKQVADLEKLPQGAYSYRVNGKTEQINCEADVEIESKTNKNGINIRIKNNTINKSVHLPVLITKGGIKDAVYNDFYVGENCDILIVAGCGIHNNSNEKSEHNGIHTFHIGKNSKVRYVEKHLGLGKNNADKILNPTTKMFLKENASLIMETTQLGGVSFSNRKTNASLNKNSSLQIKESVLTTEKQIAKSNFIVKLIGENSKAEIISKSVAKDGSFQEFKSVMEGKNECFGRVECDGILTGSAKIFSSPQVKAESPNSTLIHEASIGKIAGEELVKLQTLGLTEAEAEQVIIENFLKN